ncbi:MAG: TasA family protein [Coriobacteriia bacterium]|nr:TasA family protein [Coriobacteriia bacterium]
MLRKVIVTAVGAVLALSVGAASAYFTAQVQVPDSVIRAGTVAISTEPTVAPLSIDALAPGAVVARDVSVINDGSLPVDVVVTASKKAGITDFYEALTCRATCGETELYRGPLSSMRTAPVRLAPAARGQVRFEVGLPAEAPNTLANDYVRLSLYVDAEQVH